MSDGEEIILENNFSSHYRRRTKQNGYAKNSSFFFKSNNWLKFRFSRFQTSSWKRRKSKKKQSKRFMRNLWTGLTNEFATKVYNNKLHMCQF